MKFRFALVTWLWRYVCRREYPFIIISDKSMVPHCAFHPDVIGLAFTDMAILTFDVHDVVKAVEASLEHEYLHIAITHVVGEETSSKLNYVNRFRTGEDRLFWRKKNGDELKEARKKPFLTCPKCKRKMLSGPFHGKTAYRYCLWCNLHFTLDGYEIIEPNDFFLDEDGLKWARRFISENVHEIWIHEEWLKWMKKRGYEPLTDDFWYWYFAMMQWRNFNRCN